MSIREYLPPSKKSERSPVVLSAQRVDEGGFYLCADCADGVRVTDQSRLLDFSSVGEEAGKLADMLRRNRRYKVIINL